MPVQITVANFPDQTGETQETAIAELELVDPGVLIVFDRVHHATIAAGIVISQTVANVLPEEAGGPPGSHGVQVTLTISLGVGTWFESTANETEAARHRYNPFLAVDLDFPSGHVRVWSGYGEITIGGNVFSGLGELGRVSTVPERSNLTTDRRSYQLAGAMVDPALVSESDIDGSFARSAIKYIGFLDPETHQLVDTPEIWFEDEIANIRRGDGREPFIEVNADDRLAMLDQNDGWRYTHEHQQQFYAGDLGCEPVSRIDQREILWGGFRVGAGISYGGGGRRDDGPRRLP